MSETPPGSPAATSPPASPAAAAAATSPMGNIQQMQQNYNRYTKTMDMFGRLKANLMYFRLQYLMLTGIVFAIMLFFSPGALLEMAILAGVWIAVVVTTRQMSETIKTGAFGVMGLASIVVLFWVLEDIFWWGFGISLILVLGHALYRDPALNKDQPQSTTGHVEVPPSSPTNMADQPEDAAVGSGGIV